MATSLVVKLLVVISILFSCLNVATSNTFHIVTSFGSPCPGEYIGVPCLTLQQYVSNPSIDGNVTLMFETGNHTLSSPFIASSATQYNLIGDDCRVECASSSKFTFMSIHQVYISGIKFFKCHGGFSFTNILILNLRHSFINHINTQTSAPPVTISNVSACYIQYSDISYNRHGRYGTIYIVNSIVQINGSNFQDNYAFLEGGVIYAAYMSPYNIFKDTRISVFDSNFTNNQAYFFTGGGAIYIGYSSRYPIFLTIVGCSFVGNHGNHGGALFYSNSEVVNIQDCQFVNNRATDSNSRGGAIRSTSALNITGSRFVMNTADEGGAIHVTSRLTSEWNTFTGNVALNGGAINVQSTSLYMACEFSNNTAQNFGGAIHSSGTNSSISISNSSFTRNTALTRGGAAIYSNSRFSNITMASSTFSHNFASYCSVLDLDEYYHYNVSITDNVFTINTAKDQVLGGGVACIRNATLALLRNTFKHNYANLHGGVFYIDDCVVVVDESLFVNNSAAVDGGVFYTYVHASYYDIRRSQFSHNSAGADGGVLYIGRANSHVSIDQCIFSYNNATDRGGVAAVIGSSISMDINRTNIFNNTAEFGSIISACNSDVTIVNDEIYVTTDPIHSFCSLYDGEVTHFNISAPIDLDDAASMSIPDTEVEIAPSTTSATLHTTTMININQPRSSNVLHTIQKLTSSLADTARSASKLVTHEFPQLFTMTTTQVMSAYLTPTTATKPASTKATEPTSSIATEPTSSTATEPTSSTATEPTSPTFIEPTSTAATEYSFNFASSKVSSTIHSTPTTQVKYAPEPTTSDITRLTSSTFTSKVEYTQKIISSNSKHTLLNNPSATNPVDTVTSDGLEVSSSVTTSVGNIQDSTATTQVDASRSSFIQETELKFDILVAAVSVLFVVNIFIILLLIFVGLKFLKKHQCSKKPSDTTMFYNSKNPAYAIHTVGPIETELINFE